MNRPRRKTLDEFSDESEGFESRLDELANQPSEAKHAELVAEITAWMRECAGQGRYVTTASAERRAFRSLLERWRSRLRDQGLYVEDAEALADFDPRAGVVISGESPYPGLQPYSGRRRDAFFGREGLVSSCVAHLERPGSRILLIIGASGSGKSSLAMAGILPQLTERSDGASLFAPRFTPGASPMTELCNAVCHAAHQPERAPALAIELTARPDRAVAEIADLCKHVPLVLFIDQFEELLTLCRDPVAQASFAQVLCELSDPAPATSAFSCQILLTLRTDHLARFESNNAFRALHSRLVGEHNQIYLASIGFEDIKRAIKGPADEIGLRFIPASLIDQLASQTSGLSNGLPLLQFALARLWATRPTNEAGEPLDLITEKMVAGLPDVERALGTVADGIFQKFSTLQRSICERMLLELVVLDESFEEPLRRRRDEAELIRVLNERFDAPDEAAGVVQEFLASGLLRRFGTPPHSRIEVAHEALLRHWDHIYRLLTGAEVKERLHLIKQVGREAADWIGHEKDSDYLSLRGVRLVHAIEYARDGWLAEADAAAYVDACRLQEEAEKQRDKLAKQEQERADKAERERNDALVRVLRARRNTLRFALALALIVTTVVMWAWYRTHNVSIAERLAMTSSQERFVKPQRSLLLTLEAARISQKVTGGLLPEVETQLRAALRASRVRGLLKSEPGNPPRGVAYTPDGLLLAVGEHRGGVTLWELATSTPRKVLHGHVDDVTAIIFTPDGKTMATGGRDGRIVIWDLADLEHATARHVINAHAANVTSLAFSKPHSRVLASASEDGSVRRWDAASGAALGKSLFGHIGSVVAVAYGRDENELISAGEDGRVVIWDVRQGRVVYSIGVGELADIDVAADGSLLAIATGKEVEIWDTATRARRSTLTGHANTVFQVTFSKDQKLLATTSHDGTVRVWRLSRSGGQMKGDSLGSLRSEAARNGSPFMGMSLSPDGTAVAASTDDGTTTIWRVVAGGELVTLEGLESSVRAVQFSPDGKAIAAVSSAGRGGQLLRWDLSGQRLETPITANLEATNTLAYSRTGVLAVGSGNDIMISTKDASAPIRLRGDSVVKAMEFSPDGAKIYSAGQDGKIAAWTIATSVRQTLGTTDDEPYALALSPNGKLVATGGDNGRVRLWRADTGELLSSSSNTGDGRIHDLAFTENGQRLVSGSVDKSVRVWDVPALKEVAFFDGHTDSVSAVAIRGDRLATGSSDGIRLWDMATLLPVAVFPTRNDGAYSLAFSADGRYLAAGGEKDGVVRVYAMNGSELVELAKSRVYRGWTDEECRQFLAGQACPESRYGALDESGTRATLEPQERQRDRDAYRYVRRGRDLARLGDKEESVREFERARKTGWTLSGEPKRLMAQLRAMKVLADARQTLLSPAGERVGAPGGKIETLRETIVPQVLDDFPDVGPGYQVLANLYARQKNYASAEDNYRIAASKERSAEPLAAAAKVALEQSTGADSHAVRAARYAREALDRDAGSDEAWFRLGSAERALGHHKSAVQAFDQVSPSSTQFFANALNQSASVNFDELGLEKDAYEHLTRAAQMAPDDLDVLSKYAEILLATGRDAQAIAAAARARKQAQLEGNAQMGMAMSFTLFSAKVLSKAGENALPELAQLEQLVELSKATASPGRRGWSYTGIRRSLERRLKREPRELRDALLQALIYVETNGRRGSLDRMRVVLQV